MKRIHRSLFMSVLLTLMLVLTACGNKAGDDRNAASENAASPTAEASPEAMPTETPKDTVTPEATTTATPEATPEATPTATPEVTPEVTSEVTKPVEKNGDIVILFTSDVHCGVDTGFGYAGLWEIREYLESQGNEVILVDDGDNIQGGPLGTMTRGEAPSELMNKMGYSVAIPGNHEFDYGMEQFLTLAKKASFSYVSCNFNYKGEPVFPAYVIRELAGKKVAFVGVTTPETLSSSTPRYFMDENKEYVYGFLQDETGEGVYGAVQSAVDAARAEGADHVVVMAHLGNEAECSPWTYADVLSHTDGIDVLLDGHSHDTDCLSMLNKSGEKVLRAACGTKLANVGWCRISADGEITTGLYSWTNETSAPELLGIDNEMSRAVEEAFGELGAKLGETVASTEAALTIYDPAAVDNDGKPIRMVRRAETNLGDLCADAYRVQAGADIGICNGGAIKVSIAAGDITRKNLLDVHPYGNYLCVVEVTGQTILDALEWGAQSVPAENGGFLQVSGLTYEIHTYIDSPCAAGENGMFASISGERRVKNVLVGGEPIDPQKKYSVAGHNYMLLNFGDGYTLFDGAPVLQNCVKLDNQMLIDFFTESLGGKAGAEYAEPTGQGRIVIVSEQP